MKIIKPDYYNKFACIADRCRHNCCIGWEIDIDEDTLEIYENIPGEFGESLRSGISHGDTACFKLGEGDRCVFLNERGLCDIILHLGEDALCDICTDHPRFRNFFSGRTEIGLGLSCEEACRLILGQTDKTELVEVSFDDGNCPTDDESSFFAKRQQIFDILQDRSLSLSKRFDILSEEWGMPADSATPAQWAKFYRDLERLDPLWDNHIDILEKCEAFAEVDDNTLWEKLAVYIVYRHAADRSLCSSFTFCIHTVRMLYTLSKAENMNFEGICELCRMWSSEIEYSEENTNEVIQELTN